MSPSRRGSEAARVFEEALAARGTDSGGGTTGASGRTSESEDGEQGESKKRRFEKLRKVWFRLGGGMGGVGGGQGAAPPDPSTFPGPLLPQEHYRMRDALARAKELEEDGEEDDVETGGREGGSPTRAANWGHPPTTNGASGAPPNGTARVCHAG